MVASTPTPLNTPMLRSQTSSVLAPTWISTLGGGAATATNATTAASITTGSPPPPPPAYIGAAGGSAPANNNSMTRSPFFGSVGASQGGGRAAQLSVGLASWRNAGPTRVSPGTSPSLGPASSPNPPPPPSYTATVTTVTGTSNQSKRATIFCEIADQVYARIVNEAAASSAPIANNNSSTDEIKERENIIAAAKASDVGKYLHLIRIAGLGDDGKDKVSSAVTVACQTQLSEPSGRFYVFELAPVGSELWPSHVSGQSTPTTENEGVKPSATRTRTRSGKHSSEADDHPLTLPTASNEELWNRSRVICIACPNSTLCKSLFAKLEEVFCATEEQKKKIFVEVIRRALPVSCCLVVKASNSANKNHEAEIVPWGELMEAGAQVPENYEDPAPIEVVAAASEMNQQVTSTLSETGSSKPPPSRSTPETAKPTSSSAFPSVPPTTNNNNNNNNGKGLPSYTETITPLPPTNLGSAKLKGEEESSTAEDSSSSGGEQTKHLKRVPAPVIPSYFRLLRNERGVFRNALFLRFASQAKAEIAMMYLERTNLSGRRVRVEHKKQSRSYAQQQQTGGSSSTGIDKEDSISPALGANNCLALPPSTSTTSGAAATNMNQQYSSNSPQAQVAAAGGHGALITNAGSPSATHHEIMESNVNDLIRRYDRDGFSYPKRLLQPADLKFLQELAAAHDLLYETGTTTVAVTRPRKSASHAFNQASTANGSSSNALATSSGTTNNVKNQSPGLGSQTPPWAPQTPPLAPRFGGAGLTTTAAASHLSLGNNHASLKDDVLNLNANQSALPAGLGNGSFSERAASGTMTFRGLRHWKEQRAQAQNADGEAGSEGQEGAGGLPSLSLDSGAIVQTYIRCLDWQEAQRKGIAAWSTGRGKPVVVTK